MMKKYFFVFGALVILCLNFYSKQTFAQDSLVVNAGEGVDIIVAEGVNCSYRGRNFPRGPSGVVSVIAQGELGSTSTVLCTDGTSVDINIRINVIPSSVTPISQVTPSQGVPVTAAPMIPCIGGNANINNSSCISEVFAPSVYYNCNVIVGVNIRPTASVEISSNGSVLIGASIQIIGRITTQDTNYPIWLHTGNGYIAANLLSNMPCPIPPPPDLDQAGCPNLQSAADTLNGFLLEQIGLTGQTLCNYILELDRRRNFPALLSSEAQNNLSLCKDDPGFDAALISFINVMEIMREIDIQSHLVLREQIEVQDDKTCNFIKNLMQEHVVFGVEVNNLVYGANRSDLTRSMLQALTLSCEPFMNPDLLVEVVDTLTNVLNFTIHSISSDNQLICNLVSNLAILGGNVSNVPENRQLVRALIGTCNLSIEIAIDNFVTIIASGLSVDSVRNSIIDSESPICNLLEMDYPNDFLDLYIDLTNGYESITAEEIALISTILLDTCDSDQTSIVQLTLLLVNRWSELDELDISNIFFADDPCLVISDYLLTGNIEYTLRVVEEDIFGSNSEDSVSNGSDTSLPPEIINPPILRNQFPYSIKGIAVGLVENTNGTRHIWILNDGEWQPLLGLTGVISYVSINPSGTVISYTEVIDNIFIIKQQRISQRLVQGVLTTDYSNEIILFTSEDIERQGYTLATERFAITMDGRNLIISLRDSNGTIDVYSLPINPENGSSVYSQAVSITSELSGDSLFSSYLPDVDGILIENNSSENELDNQRHIYYGTEFNNQNYIWRDPNLDCDDPRSPTFNGTSIAMFMICTDVDNTVFIIERNHVGASKPLDALLYEEVGVPITLQGGPTPGFLTIFNDEGEAYFITIANDTEIKDSIAITLDPEFDSRQEFEITISNARLLQLYWAVPEEESIEYITQTP